MSLIVREGRMKVGVQAGSAGRRSSSGWQDLQMRIREKVRARVSLPVSDRCWRLVRAEVERSTWTESGLPLVVGVEFLIGEAVMDPRSDWRST